MMFAPFGDDGFPPLTIRRFFRYAQSPAVTNIRRLRRRLQAAIAETITEQLRKGKEVQKKAKSVGAYGIPCSSRKMNN